MSKSALAGGDPGEGSQAFSGTLVVAGQGAAVVTATGPRSRLGEITALLERVEELQTPLVRQMNIFAQRSTAVILGLSALTFAYACLVGGYSMAEAFMVVVGMAVAAIPEGLPAVTTITMAIGVQRMARRNAILRRLPAIEALGCVSTICSDKTGTLTKNEMTVARIVTAAHEVQVSGVGYGPRGGFVVDGREIDPKTDAVLERLIRTAGLCNEASLRQGERGWMVDGDPLEGALIVAAVKAGLNPDALHKTYPRVDEVPFDASYRYMATLHRGRDDTPFLCVKGAPEKLLELCETQLAAAGAVALDRAYWTRAVERLAASGFRVLALASKSCPGCERIAFADIEGLVFEGLVGLIDPPARGGRCCHCGVPLGRHRGEDDHRGSPGDGAGNRRAARHRHQPAGGRGRSSRRAR